MLAAIQPLDEGPLDFNRKSGDVVFAKLDTDPGFGNQEKKSWLAIQFPDPVNTAGNPFPTAFLEQMRDDMQKEEYAPGASPDANEVRRARRYSIPAWRLKFSPTELEIIDDATQVLPDGPTAFGGTVLSGVVSGLFTFQDIVRK